MARTALVTWGGVRKQMKALRPIVKRLGLVILGAGIAGCVLLLLLAIWPGVVDSLISFSLDLFLLGLPSWLVLGIVSVVVIHKVIKLNRSVTKTQSTLILAASIAPCALVLSLGLWTRWALPHPLRLVVPLLLWLVLGGACVVGVHMLITNNPTITKTRSAIILVASIAGCVLLFFGLYLLAAAAGVIVGVCALILVIHRLITKDPQLTKKESLIVLAASIVVAPLLLFPLFLQSRGDALPELITLPLSVLVWLLLGVAVVVGIRKLVANKRIVNATVMKAVCTAILDASIAGSVLVLFLSIHPGVVPTILSHSFWLLFLPLTIAALFVCAAMIWMLIKQPKQSLLSMARLPLAAACLFASLVIAASGVLPRGAFLLCRSSFEPFIASAPTSKREKRTLLDRRLGFWHVDRYAADRRGGVYFPVGTFTGFLAGTVTYGFAYKPNAEGSPFGNAYMAYHTVHITGDWFYFRDVDPW